MRFAVLGLLAGACAFAAQDVYHGPTPPGMIPECDDGSGYAVVDGLVSLATLIAAARMVDCDNTNEDNDCLGSVLVGIVIVLPISGIFAMSALYGVNHASECQEVRRLMDPRTPPPR